MSIRARQRQDALLKDFLLKILFVNGPSQDCCDRFFGWPTSLLYAIAPSIAEMDAGRLDMEYDPDLFDPVFFVADDNAPNVLRELRDRIHGVDIVCASTTYDSVHPTMTILREAKAVNPEIITIIGGPHVDEVHRMLQHNVACTDPSIVDFAVAGDGEYALLGLLRALSDGGIEHLRPETLTGRACIYYEDKVAVTNGQPLVLDHLPFMQLELADSDRHRYDFDIFRSGDGSIMPTAQMIAKRGCGYECVFCSERKSLAYPNARSIENILDEIEKRKHAGFKAIFFDDSTFGLYPQLDDLLRELADTGMKFGCLNRFNHLLTEKRLNLYREAGFDYLYCSIEQFNDAALSAMKKGQSTSKIEQSIALLHKVGFSLGVSLLYGLEYETEESVRATLDYTQRWVEAGLITLVSESVLSFHPGTPAGSHLKESFDRVPPNRGYPFDRFEEGQWYHHDFVTADYLDKICRWSEQRFGRVMVRNRHSWYAEHGYSQSTDS